MKYNQQDNFLLLTGFSLATLILGLLNLKTYPYISETGLIFTTWILLISFTGVSLMLYRGEKWFSNKPWQVFSAFTITILISRVFVNTAGIATPKSTGSIASLQITQLWFNGIHLHHYWLGITILLLITTLKKHLTQTHITTLTGIGSALIIDELGIIIAGHTYHSWISYTATITTHTLLLTWLITPQNQIKSPTEKINQKTPT